MNREKTIRTAEDIRGRMLTIRARLNDILTAIDQARYAADVVLADARHPTAADELLYYSTRKLDAEFGKAEAALNMLAEAAKARSL